MPSKILYPWKRYWVKQGESPSMHDGLFVEPSGGPRWYTPNSNGISLLELRDVPCLILLGDVGMGKSTTVQQASEELKTEVNGQNHVVAYHDLKRLSETQIVRHIFETAEFEGWSRGEQTLTLFLDSLDECWRRIEALELLLVDEFEYRIKKAKTTLPLFLRLTCRSAEWRGTARTILDRLFSKKSESNASDPIQLVVLAPLSKNNVQDAAKSNGLDGERLLDRIINKEAQALASHPITFEMLLQTYRESDDFPKSRVALYKDGCLKLCADEHVIAGALQSRKTTAGHRFAVAGRLAAASVFTNRFLINGDLDRPVAKIDVLDATDVVGHMEERVAGEQITVDREKVTETLQTGLFAEKIEGLQTWRHQSYAEFLSALYLAGREVSAEQVASIFTDSTDNSRRIVPQLEEAACWMAEIKPDVFKILAKTNADIFLRCDSTYWSDADRTILVDSYLNLIRRHEAAEIDWQLKYRLARLNHPNLAEQLRARIASRDENPLVRETAIDIAGYCEVQSVATELVHIFLDVADIFRVRKHAAIALERASNDQVRERLKQNKELDWQEDFDDELKGYYLQITVAISFDHSGVAAASNFAKTKELHRIIQNIFSI